MSVIQKLRDPKIGGVAIFDLGGSIVIALLIAQRLEVSKLKTVVFILALGEAVHVALGVSTPITRKILQPRSNGNNNTERSDLS